MRRFLLVVVAVLPLAATLAACGDSTGLGKATIFRDSSVVLAAPTAAVADTVPSAVDLQPFLLRFPEQLGEAAQWDFALRRSGSTLRLIPNTFLSNTLLPLIARSSQTLAAIDRAPTARSAYGDSAITLVQGGVYIMRSRRYSNGLGGTCYVFAKAQVTALDLAKETATFILVVNPGCADDRLEEDS